MSVSLCESVRLSHAASLSLSLCVSFFTGPGRQRQGPAEYGHHVLSADHLTHGVSEQDGSPGPLQANLPHHRWGESLTSDPYAILSTESTRQ